MKIDHKINKDNHQLCNMDFKNFTKMELNIFLALCEQVAEQETLTISLTASQLRQLSGFKSTSISRLSQVVNATFRKSNQIMFKYYNSNTEQLVSGVLFTTIFQDSRTGAIKVKVNEDAAPILNDLENHYTMYLLPDFVGITNKYAKIMYMTLMQWRTTKAEFTWSIPELQEKLGFPKSYPVYKINERVINPIKQKLSKLMTNFAIDSIKNGRNTIGYTFRYNRMAKLPNPSNQQLKRIGELDRIAQDKKKQREENKREMNNDTAFKGPDIPFIKISDIKE